MNVTMPDWLRLTITEEETKTLTAGRAITRNGKVYAVCAKCHSVIRVDKPLIGSVHFCEPEPER